jgi:uncharacterized protein
MAAESVQFQCFRSDILQLIVMPTEACNFRCTYCYETFEHKKMPRSVVTGIKSLIDRRGDDLNELQVDWFGGEPLLAFDVVTDICRHAIKVAKSNGFYFSSEMTTNGYFLDRKRFSTCLEHGIRSFQISFDGDEHVHNASRKLASGAGTFDRIWANVMGMRDVSAEFRTVLRLHYTYENFLSIAEFARRINDALAGDSRFQFFFKNIVRLGGPNDESITIFSDDERKDIEAYLLEAVGLVQPPGSAEEEPCYAGKGNSLVIRSTGRLAKCTVALTDDFNDIGSIKENGDICVDQDKFRRWIAPVIEGRWEETACPLGWVAREADLAATRAKRRRPRSYKLEQTRLLSD